MVMLPRARSMSGTTVPRQRRRHTMLAIQPWGCSSAEEELRAVGVWTGVGHAEYTRSIVLQFEVLIIKGVPVD